MWLVLGQSLMVISTTGILMQKYIPFIMYYGSALLLFTPKVHSFEHMTAVWAIKAVKFHTHIY